jgi:glutamate synthase (NADPH) small chain
MKYIIAIYAVIVFLIEMPGLERLFMDDYHMVRLIMTAEVKAMIQNRRLKDEDIQKTIFQAETTGQKFVHPENGHFLAGVRPYFVTVWVEYTLREEGYEIQTAYQHRVKITGEKSP